MPSVPQERSGVAGCRSVFLWVSLWRSTIRLGLTEGSKGVGGLKALGYQSPVSSRDVGRSTGSQEDYSVRMLELRTCYKKDK